MPTLQIHDLRPSGFAVIDPRSVLPLLGERALRSSWRVAGVAPYDEAPMIVGDGAADQLEELARSKEIISGSLLYELVYQTSQIIWGEFAAYENGEFTPWVIVRAIDSTWCEVETADLGLLDLVRQTFKDVRLPV